MTHSWSAQELWTVCVCYKEGLPVELALRLTNTTNEKSMKMRYQNCKYLENGPGPDALSHPSKKHVEVWQSVSDLYSKVSPIPVKNAYINEWLIVITAVLVLLNVIKILAI